MTDVLIVGAGLSGLALARHLAAAGVAHEVLEGRARIGGRVLSAGGGLDMGPAWIWPGQPRIARLLTDLGLATFPQHSRGTLAFEDRGGAIRRDLTFATMEGALRVTGGMARLTEALAAALPAPVRVNAEIRALALTEAGVTATLAGGETIRARRVALCLPPRVVAARIAFSPALPADAMRALARVPTWMAGQAKAMAVYDAPFWRARGLSGDAISHVGPMAEVHDASPADTAFGALFGFIGVPAAARLADSAALRDACAAQFARLFDGPPAREVWIEDWAGQPLTATPADHAGGAHPTYGPLGAHWDGRVRVASTETAPEFGGFLEGALEAAEAAARALIR